MRFLNVLGAAMLTIFLVAVSLPVSGLDIYLNGNLVSAYSAGDLAGLSKDLSDKTAPRSVSLLELSPLLAECDRIEVDGASTEKVWVNTGTAPDLSYAFQDALVVASGSGWDFDFAGKRVSSVENILITGDPLEETRLQVWVSWEGVRELREEIESFAALHHVKVDILEVANIRAKLLTVQRAGGAMPDIVMVQSSYLPELLARRILQPIDPIVQSTGHLSGTDAFTVKGNVWALPFYFDTQLVFYNPELVKPPPEESWTLGEFETVLEKLAHENEAPASWNAYSAYWLTPFLFAFGRTSLADEGGTVTLADDASRLAIEYLYRLFSEGLLVPLERDAMIGRFLRGETGLILSGSYSIPLLKRTGFSYRTLPLPAELSPIRDFKGFAVTRRSRHSLLARRFVQHFANRAVQLSFSRKLSKLPARTVGAAPSARGVALPPSPGYELFKNTVWQLLRLIFSGDITVEEGIAAGQRIISGETQ